MKKVLMRFDEVEVKLIQWCKKVKYSQGDSYYVRINENGGWVVGYSNDYPLQHGEGKSFVLTGQEFQDAIKA